MSVLQFELNFVFISAFLLAHDAGSLVLLFLPELFYGLAQLLRSTRSAGRLTGSSTGCNENAQLAPSEKNALRECGWKDGDSGDSAPERKIVSNEKTKEPI